jgi:hypothetical protein
MVAKNSTTMTESTTLSQQTIPNQGLKNDKQLINSIFKAGVPSSKSDLLNNIDDSNTLLTKIIEKSDITYDTENSQQELIYNIEKVYKNLRNKKNNITSVDAVSYTHLRAHET